MKNVIKKMLRYFLPPLLQDIIRQQRWKWNHPGTHYSCPFCHHQFGCFIPYNNPYSISIEVDIISGQSIEAFACPYCLSNDRERNLFFYFQKNKDFIANKRLLHFAPEKRLHSLLTNNHCKEYICGDLSPQNYHHFTKDIKQINILHIPYSDAYFDLVICNHVLEHIPDDIAAMKEIYRVLKPQGVAILLVPIGAKLEKTLEDSSKETEEQRSEAFGQYDHVRIYAEADYIKRLEATNFKVEIGSNRLTSEEIIKYGINPREKLFIACKQ